MKEDDIKKVVIELDNLTKDATYDEKQDFMTEHLDLLKKRKNKLEYIPHILGAVTGASAILTGMHYYAVGKHKELDRTDDLVAKLLWEDKAISYEESWDLRDLIIAERPKIFHSAENYTTTYKMAAGTGVGLLTTLFFMGVAKRAKRKFQNHSIAYNRKRGWK